MVRSIWRWLDDRTSHRAAFNSLLDSPLPGGAHWARTFGALVVILFAVEALTGVGLALWYAPTTTDAWASVHFIQYQLTLGWMLRGLHHATGNVLIVVAILHLLQALLWGAWKAPRELSWIAGLVGLQVLILISHTGYLLPWDLRSYWATQVLVGIAGNQPGVGELAVRLIQGGAEVGNATLTHLYAMHVLLTPGLFAGAIAVHFWLKRKHGELAPPDMTAEVAAEKAQTWFPHQLVRDLAAGMVVMLGIALWVWRQGGIELGAPADPAIEYVARPEWYFLPIFHLRHWFTGSFEFIATTVIPGLAVTALASLPFLHQRLASRVKNVDRLLIGGTSVGMAFALYLGVATAVTDAANEKEQEINARAEEWAKVTHRLAMIGVPVTGPLSLYENDALLWGQKVFGRECAACHAPGDTQPYEGSVCLDGYASRTWIKKFMRKPDAPHFFGNTKIDAMDAFEGDGEKLDAITEFLYQQSGRPDADPTLAAEGAVLYDKEGCLECHALNGTAPADPEAWTGPDLKGWAGEAWLAAFIRQPGHDRFYGKLNEMDEFDAEQLTKIELQMVIAWLRSQSDEKAGF
ncbi:MAG: Cytochrome b/b6 domain protein [Myxococcaceae bacterium]|nr:Cytochrome b/b6 domain protein [Myxococcaceae bacterium]